MHLRENEMTNQKRWELASKQYITSEEIKLIAEVGINKARELRKEIEKKHCEKMLLPKYKIPTKFLLKELGISLKEIYRLAKMEREL